MYAFTLLPEVSPETVLVGVAKATPGLLEGWGVCRLAPGRVVRLAPQGEGGRWSVRVNYMHMYSVRTCIQITQCQQ